MSPTDAKATDQSEQNDSAASDESDDRRQPDEDEDGQKDEEKDEQQTKAEKQDEEDDDSSSRPDLWKKFAGALPLIFGLGFCVAFFVWVCLQMAGQTVGGPPLLLGIFGASILGILAAGAGVGLTRMASSNDDE